MPQQATLSRRAFLKITLASAVSTTLAGVGGFVYSREIEPGWIDVEPVRLTLPRLSPAFDGYRIVQISDLHADYWMNRDRLASIVELVNREKPDLVAITGDFVTYTPEVFANDLISTLRQLQARDSTVAVLGNHDHWTDAGTVREIIRASGIVNVSNTVHTLQRDNELLHIAGIDDYWEKQDRLDLVLDALPHDNHAAVLLAHEPDYADISAQTGRFDLQISGHSHGGQVIFPFMGPPILPTYGQKYPVGLYRVGTMLQYTNRGLGMVAPAVRFNCRPEITVFTLTPARV
jgi:predicted MPP superfamily phosphohydrolase